MVVATVRLLKYWPLASLGRARFTASTRAGQVLEQLLGLETGLAEGHVDDTALVDRNSTRPPLTSPIDALEVEGDGPRLGIGHEAAAAEDPAQLADLAHEVRGGEGHVELEPARTRPSRRDRRRPPRRRPREGFLGLVALGEDGDAHELAGAVGQHDGAAHHLVGVPRVDAQPHVGLHGWVEVDARGLLEQVDRFVGRVHASALHELGQRPGSACRAWTSVRSSVRPWRASPCDAGWTCRCVVLHAAGDRVRPAGRPRLLVGDLDAHRAGRALDDAGGGVEVVGVEVDHLGLGDLRSWARLTLPTRSRPVVDEPFSTPAALRSRSAAGGVLSTKVKLRSSKMVIWAGMTWPAWAAVRSL